MIGDICRRRWGLQVRGEDDVVGLGAGRVHENRDAMAGAVVHGVALQNTAGGIEILPVEFYFYGAWLTAVVEDVEVDSGTGLDSERRAFAIGKGEVQDRGLRPEESRAGRLEGDNFSGSRFGLERGRRDSLRHGASLSFLFRYYCKNTDLCGLAANHIFIIAHFGEKCNIFYAYFCNLGEIIG